jgi:hypothetical protein
MLPFPQGPTIVSRHSCSVLALFDQGRCVAPQDAIGLPALVRHELVRVPPQLRLIPHGLAEKALQAPEAPTLDGESDWLKGFPGQGALRPNHVIQEMGAGLTPRKTIMEDPLKCLSLVHEAFDISALHVKGRNPERLTGSAATRPHRQSPAREGSTGAAYRGLSIRSRINGVVGLCWFTLSISPKMPTWCSMVS